MGSGAQARGGQAASDVSIWGPLLAPLSLAGQRVGPRHSCGWEPRLEANGAEAAADATADASSEAPPHPASPPSSSRQPAREPEGAEGSGREGRLGGLRPGPARWSAGASGGRGEGGGGTGCCRHQHDAGSPGSRQDGRRERYVSVPGGACGSEEG